MKSSDFVFEFERQQEMQFRWDANFEQFFNAKTVKNVKKTESQDAAQEMDK